MNLLLVLLSGALGFLGGRAFARALEDARDGDGCSVCRRVTLSSPATWNDSGEWLVLAQN